MGLFAMARRLLIFKTPGKQRAAWCGTRRSSVMVFALGAVSSALDAIKSLTSSKSSSSQTTGSSQASANPFDLSSSAPTSPSPAPVSGSNGSSQLAPVTFGALLAAQGQSTSGTTASAPASKLAGLNELFSLANANGGQISKSQFESAFGAGGTNIANADKVFDKLDTNGDGSVNLGELSSALKGAGGKGHHHHAHVGGSDGSSDSTGTDSSSTDASSTDPLLQALQATSGTTVTNSDGSSTTTSTNADGSKVTLTSPAAATASSSATSSYNLIEQLIQRAAQGISSSATASLSVSV
jgi:hypothetical protein